MSRGPDDPPDSALPGAPPVEFEDLASLIGDGAECDWDLERTRLPQEQHSIVQHFEILNQIARFHRAEISGAGLPGAPADDPATMLQGGTTWADLVIIREIGSGSFGRVYRAWDPTLEREVALKIIAVAGPGEQAFAPVVREGRLLAKVRHPNVVTVYGARQIGSVAGIWMELVEGESLADLVERSGPLKLERAAAIVRSLCAGLSAVHDAGLVHRDVKARNVVIDGTGRVVLMDFGAGRDVRELPEAQLAGTPLYMAPELFDGVNASPQTDVYSVGVLFYFLLTGSHPISGRTLATVVLEHERAADGNHAIDLEPVPQAARPVLAAALSRDPATRPVTAASFADALSSVAAPRALTRSSRLAWVAGVAALVALTLIAVLQLNREAGRASADLPMEISNHRTLTTSSDIDEYPVISPNGAMVAFSAAKDGGPLAGNWDIWITAAAGGDAVNATEDYTGADRFPVWSPDGKLLAFWSDRDNGGCFVIPAAGGRSPQRVAEAHLLHGTRPAWSPDGKSVACVMNHSRNPVITLTNLDGGTSSTVAMPGTQGRVFDLAWSPDGQSLAYIDAPALSADRSMLRLLDLTTGETRGLTDGATNVWAPQWSVDGTTLFFAANLGGAMDLWKLRPENPQEVSVPTPVTTGVGLRSFSLTTDGKHLVFSKGQRAANAWTVRIDAGRPANWETAEEVTAETALVETLDSDPNTGEIVIGSDRGGSPQLWALSPKDARRSWRRLVTNPQTQWGGRVSSKGDVAFYGLSGQSRKIWLSSAGGRVTQVTDGPSDDVFPSWHPDGQSLTFYSNRTGHWDVWTRRLSDGAERRITTDAGDDSFPDWSPDGRRLVYTSVRSGNPVLWTATVNPLANQQLTSGPAWLGRWMSSGEDVVFIGHGTRANTLWKVNVRSRSETMVADLRNRRGSLGRFALAVHEGAVYFAWETTGGDLWMADVVNSPGS